MYTILQYFKIITLTAQNVEFKIYAADTQVYIPIAVGNSKFYLLKNCLKDTTNWLPTFKLKLHILRTEVIIWQRTFSLDVNILTLPARKFQFQDLNLFANYRVILISPSPRKTILKLQFILSCSPENIRIIRDLIDKGIAHMLGHSFVTDLIIAIFSSRRCTILLLKRLLKVSKRGRCTRCWRSTSEMILKNFLIGCVGWQYKNCGF